MPRYLVAEFTAIDAPNAEEAKARVAELEGDVVSVQADPYNGDILDGLNIALEVMREMNAGWVIMTVDDVRTRIEESQIGDGAHSPYHGLDASELALETVNSHAWNRGFSNDAIMESAWVIVEFATDAAAERLRERQLVERSF